MCILVTITSSISGGVNFNKLDRPKIPIHTKKKVNPSTLSGNKSQTELPNLVEIEELDELEDETKSAPCEENKVEIVCESESKKGADDDEDDEDDAIWNLSRIYNANEIRSVCPALCDINGCQIRSCSLWNSDKGEVTNVCLDCQQEEFGGWPNGLKPADEKHYSCITSFCSKSSTPMPQDALCIEKSDDALIVLDSSYHETITSNSISDSKVIDLCASQEISSHPSKAWRCSQCTFENEDTEKKCQMYDQYRPAKKPRICFVSHKVHHQCSPVAFFLLLF